MSGPEVPLVSSAVRVCPMDVSTTPAGWYPDPGHPQSLRYWDGAAWLERYAPAPGVVPQAATAAAPVRSRLTLATGFGMAQRAFSLRVIFTSLVIGGIAGVVVGIYLPSLTMPAFWGVAALCYLGTVANGAQMTKCDACMKRVKMGASTCHHCGYSRA